LVGQINSKLKQSKQMGNAMQKNFLTTSRKNLRDLASISNSQKQSQELLDMGEKLNELTKSVNKPLKFSLQPIKQTEEQRRSL
jgi:uncharacterized FlaG/YvyC family protein